MQDRLNCDYIAHECIETIDIHLETFGNNAFHRYRSSQRIKTLECDGFLKSFIIVTKLEEVELLHTNVVYSLPCTLEKNGEDVLHI
mmetsp:Transcript_19838/g.28901  ORF Transcript_19838/g.28901 Transcript_19838/m.28901 type:complete len:86 (-) Transcript_19838:774-1031(-)